MQTVAMLQSYPAYTVQGQVGMNACSVDSFHSDDMITALSGGMLHYYPAQDLQGQHLDLQGIDILFALLSVQYSCKQACPWQAAAPRYPQLFQNHLYDRLCIQLGNNCHTPFFAIGCRSKVLS